MKVSLLRLIINVWTPVAASILTSQNFLARVPDTHLLGSFKK